MDLSIVIVSWNTCDLLQQCLAAVFPSSTNYSFDVWVVDNASTDDSVKMVQEKFPSVHLITCKENQGFAFANNLAIEQTNARYVMLLNPDTEIESQAIEFLTGFMDAHPEIGAVGPKLLNPDGTLQISSYPIPTLTREFWRMFHLDTLLPVAAYPMSYWKNDFPIEVDVIMGACLLLRKELINQIGLLDASYFMYTEEVDLCYRIQQAGSQLYWLPQARVVHYGGQSTKQVRQEMFVNLYRSKVLFFRKHYGGLRTNLYKWILFIASFVRLAISPLAIFSKPAQRDEQMVLVSNYRRLISEVGRM